MYSSVQIAIYSLPANWLIKFASFFQLWTESFPTGVSGQAVNPWSPETPLFAPENQHVPDNVITRLPNMAASIVREKLYL